MFKIPLYVVVLIMIVITLFIIVRENFIGFDETKPPAERAYSLVPSNPFATACL